ncbi:hypothetical protein G7Y89_g5817 [Cudoniella acicularis]|uniref:Cell surface spherulin 4-like protein n=1 Tax=Cudoniella acicularis TaxID=354080 RepID=A0A8H4RP03_9HELO|nr:hypothetical protein G7Y89_g5817 [Cudoniella acicularis]
MVLPYMILVPLYIYPNATSWNPLYESLAAYPNTTFNIVINPGSGPGPNPLPDLGYIDGIAKLNKYNNSNLLGYVDANYAFDPPSALKAINQISTYANWSKADSAQHIHVNGIFFDDAPIYYSDFAYGYMKNISSAARNMSLSTIVFNPGNLNTSSRYYDLADYLIISEDTFANLNETLLLSKTPRKYRKQTALIIHGFNATKEEQFHVVQKFLSDGFGGLFITTKAHPVEYFSFSDLWSDFVSIIGTIVGVGNRKDTK